VLTAAGRAMRRRMWTVYGTAISELFDAHLNAAETLQMATFLDRVLQAARTNSS